MPLNAIERPLGIMIHYFHDRIRFMQGQGTLTAYNFERILDSIGHDRILNAEEWVSRARTDRLAPGDVCLTFDHALYCQYTLALPILRQRGLTAIWFVCTAALTGTPPPLEAFRRFRCEYFKRVEDFYAAFFHAADTQFPGGRVHRALDDFPDDYLAEFTFYSVMDRKFRYLRDRVLGPGDYVEIMNRAIESRGLAVKDLSNGIWLEDKLIRALRTEGHVIGLHSHSHPMLIERESPETQYAEYKTNRDVLTDILGEPPTTMSHPNNSYSNVTLDILRGLGIELGFRSNTKMDGGSLLELPRIDVADIRYFGGT